MSWKVVQMRSFLSERKGRYKPGDKTVLGLKRIDKIDFSGNIFLSEKPSKTDMILIKQGDLVISGINVEKGAMSIYKGEDDVIATIHYSSYEYNPEKIDIDFLRHFLKSPEFIDALKEQVPGGIKTEIKPKHILPLKVCIPTNVEEQREVVTFLDQQNKTLETQSTELTHQLDLVKQLRRAFLREAMQGKLMVNGELSIVNGTDKKIKINHSQLTIKEETGAELLEKIKAEKECLIKEKKIKKQKPLPPITEDEIPFEIPENWVWCRLGELAQLIFDGPFGSHLKTADYKPTGVRVIRLENLGEMEFISEKETFVSLEKYETIKSHEVFEGDVIIGSFLADGVRCTVLPDLNQKAIAKADCFTIRLVRELTENRYIMFLLSSSPMFHELFSLLRGMTRLRINTTQLKSLAIPLPPLTEQKRIVAKLDELMAHCDALEASIKESQTQNELLLQQVLRVALEPRDEEVELI